MPRAALHTLAWSSEHHCYELILCGQRRQSFSTSQEPGWFHWLETTVSFAFHGRCGQLNVYREARGRHNHYWYAYHTCQGRTHKRYLGPNAAVTFARLEDTAMVLQTPSSSAVGARALPRQPTMAPVVPPLASSKMAPLGTVLSPPPLPSRLLVRDRLLAHLDEAQTHQLTLLSAAAGWGKTTLLSAWASHTSYTVAWLALDPRDNDPVRFWVSVIAALRHSASDLSQMGEQALSMLRSPQSPGLPTILTSLLHDLCDRTEPLFLLLDDYHRISDPSIHDSLCFALAHLPVHLHLILSSRVDPPFPLSRLRVAGQLLEIRHPDLSFQPAEATRFLSQTMALSLTSEEVTMLVARTEGWIAGLQLAALALQHQSDHSTVIQGFTGSHRYVLDYLQEEVLAHLPTPLQGFLSQSAILNQLSAPLCQAVTASESLQECQDLLERAEWTNLFLIPLDEKRGWYRLHDLFREALLTRLHHKQSALVPLLHRRAAGWYEARGEIGQAIEHRLVAADYPTAAVLMKQMVEAVWLAGEVQTLFRWIMALPDEVFREHARMALTVALYLTSSAYAIVGAPSVTARTRVGQIIARVEATMLRNEKETDDIPEMLRARSIPAAERELLSRRMRLLLLWRAAHETIETNDWEQHSLIVRQMQTCEQDEEVLWQMPSLSVAFIEKYSLRQRGGILIPELLSVRQRVEQAGDRFAMIKVRQWLALALCNAGRLRQAYQESLEALALLEQMQGYTLLRGYFAITLAEVCYAWNRLEDARQILRTMIHDIETWQQIDILIWGYITLVQIELAAGDTTAAEEALQEAERLAPPQGWEIQNDWLPAFRAQLCLVRGNLAEASNRAIHVDLPQRTWNYISHLQVLMEIRVLLARRQDDQALETLERWSQHLDRPGENLLTTCSFLALTVVALQQAGKRGEACAVATRLLALTEAEGFVRVYLDAGPTMQQVLHHLLRASQDASGDAVDQSRVYILKLLQAFEQEANQPAEQYPGASLPPASTFPPLPASAAAPLLEPFTSQEQRILRLLAAGCSTQEIARHLVISRNTVKTHVRHLYGKLGVHNRMQASSRARDLHLL